MQAFRFCILMILLSLTFRNFRNMFFAFVNSNFPQFPPCPRGISSSVTSGMFPMETCCDCYYDDNIGASDYIIREIGWDNLFTKDAKRNQISHCGEIILEIIIPEILTHNGGFWCWAHCVNYWIHCVVWYGHLYPVGIGSQFLRAFSQLRPVLHFEIRGVTNYADVGISTRLRHVSLSKTPIRQKTRVFQLGKSHRIVKY